LPLQSMLIYRNHKQLKTSTSHNDRALSVAIHFFIFTHKKYKLYLVKDYFQVWTFNVQQIPLQHDDSLYFIACRNAMGFRCILRLVAEMKIITLTIQNFRQVIQKRYLATLGYFQIY
jgi:predicted solute-binding protein